MAVVTLEPLIRRLELEVAQLERVAKFNEGILAELMRSSPPPADLVKVRGYLRSASDLLKHSEQATAEELVLQAQGALGAVRQWLAVGDLGISPFLLRTSLEKGELNVELLIDLVRYFLAKQPHAENDRDKLDYLITSHFGASQVPAAGSEKLRAGLDKLFEGIPRLEPSPAAEMMTHELESLISLIGDIHDFDQLVKARMVERARALKINLGEDFYHPRILPAVIRFNLAFRRRFEQLFEQQLSGVRQMVRQQIEEAWTLVGAIEAACEKLTLSPAERGAAAAADEEEAADDSGLRVGRALHTLDERPPIDRLVRQGAEPQKENELRGLISRITRFLEKLPPGQAKAEKVTFPLREASLDLVLSEREAFGPAATSAAPESTRAIQYSVGVMAWLEEELVRYKQSRGDRYLWKTHFDLISYAVVRSVELLKTIRGLLRQDAPAGEAAWFGSLLQTALRLATALNKVAPVFAEPA